ncbi:MAG: hypothetical protein MZV63_49555 [Marinilabiliales bacterium]|nr:hypothetical protein [Marinilabiliales bacterium]
MTLTGKVYLTQFEAVSALAEETCNQPDLKLQEARHVIARNSGENIIMSIDNYGNRTKIKGGKREIIFPGKSGDLT